MIADEMVAGLSLAKWCVKNDWSRVHVVLTLSGDRESKRVMEAVREFTEEQEAAMRERLTLATVGGGLAVA